MKAAMDSGLFSEDPIESAFKPPVTRANIADMSVFASWSKELEKASEETPLIAPVPEVWQPPPSLRLVDAEPAVIRQPANKFRNPSTRPELMILNTEQRRAHDIVEGNLIAFLNGQQPEQLLMLVLGQGGTGKSLLISAISATFDEHGATELLARTATSGVAASLIGGKTVHTWAAIPVPTPSSEGWLARGTKETIRRRNTNIVPTLTLIIDEGSMMTKGLFTCLSEVAGTVKSASGMGNPTKAFGGLNVILFGDFHQFPPVGNAGGALYNHLDESIRGTMGRALFLQFTTVVILKEQNRVRDPVWRRILDRLRVGECEEPDLQEIRKLIVTRKESVLPDMSKEPWKDAVLITPRHAVRERWNHAALHRHATQSGNRLYISPAEDTIGRQREELSMKERVMVAGMKNEKTAHLADRVTLSVGMKAMVILNLATDKELANGTRGTIDDIVLDPREELVNPEEDGSYHLKYPPALVLFKPDAAVKHHFQGLKDGVLPITPSDRSFSMKDENGKSFTIHRRQMAMTPAYAFTDFKSQGQTLVAIFVDLAPPPKSGLSPFSAYVALSRSRGRDNIRLLRDFDDELFTNHPKGGPGFFLTI